MTLPSNKLLETLTLIRLASREQGVTLEELERDCGIPHKRVMDLLECLPQVAIPPEGPDDMLDLEIEQGNVIRVYYPLRLDLPMDLGERDVLALRLALLWGAEHAVIDPEVADSVLSKIENRRQGLEGRIDLEGVEVHYPQASDGRSSLPVLRRALVESRVLHLNYYSKARGLTSERTVKPYRLVTSEGFWYLRGWQAGTDFSEEGWRSFRVDRIERATISEETFDRGDLPDLARAETLFWFEEERGVETTTRFSPSTAKFVREVFPASEISEEAGGALILTHEVVGFPYYRAFVLAFGRDAEVLGPEDFREGIRTTLEGLLGALDRTTDGIKES